MALAFAFVVAVNPFGNLPVSLPVFQRGPVDGNARYSFPMLARDQRFDSALFGTSSVRLLRPAALDPALGARLANLSMNSATSYEQIKMLGAFLHAHPNPRLIAIGLDVQWCKTAADDERYGFGDFPEWMYNETWPGRWSDYRHVLTPHAIEVAGRAFAEWTGLKPRVYGADGYTSFVPPDAQYDLQRALGHMDGVAPWDMGRDPDLPPEAWRMTTVERLAGALSAIPPRTLKLLFFVPYNHRFIASAPGSAHAAQTECKRRIAELARSTPNTALFDFMIDSPITRNDENYWDVHHYRVGIAERIAADLGAAVRGERSEDFAVLAEPLFQHETGVHAGHSSIDERDK